MHALRNVVALAQRQPATDGRARAGGHQGVQRIDVEREVDGGVVADVAQRHLHHPPDAVPVNVVHAEGANAMLSQDQLLPPVHVPQADVDQLLDAEQVLGLQPPEHILSCLLGQPREERNRHAVHIPAVAALGRVDVGVRIDPDDGHLPTQPLPDGLRRPADRADGNGMVAAEGEHEAALLGVRVDLFRELLRHGRDRERVFHPADIRIRGGDELFVGVHRIIVMELVPELFAQLGEETALDQGRGRSVDSWFALRGVSLRRSGGGATRLTWPPEKPTATTPSWSGLERNLGWIMEVVVMLEMRRRRCYSDRRVKEA